ncbi:hypothetical protein GQX74_009262 [Glossina fuscipes]|nr:hypothetical protein GQX74_009262 [Glossina fuscipes]
MGALNHLTDINRDAALHLAALAFLFSNLMGYQYAHHSMAVPGLLHAIQFCRFSCYIASSIHFNELVLASWKKAQEEQ